MASRAAGRRVVNVQACTPRARLRAWPQIALCTCTMHDPWTAERKIPAERPEGG